MLRGMVRFITRQDGATVDAELAPGDACFIEASVPHTFAETSFTPYQPPGAELLVVQWTPLTDSERSSVDVAPPSSTDPTGRHNGHGSPDL